MKTNSKFEVYETRTTQLFYLFIEFGKERQFSGLFEEKISIQSQPEEIKYSLLP